MMRSLSRTGSILVVSLVILLALFSCGDEDSPTGTSGGGSAETIFICTPTVMAAPELSPAQFQIKELYEFHCVDETTPTCIAYQFQDDEPNHSGDWMGFPKTDRYCIPFIAIVTVGDSKYEFTGAVQRAFGQTGLDNPFATGTYMKLTPGQNEEMGTFEFYEQKLTKAETPICS